MTQYTTVSLSQLECSPTGELITVSGRTFDPCIYSEFKYGNRGHASDYARLLAPLVVADQPALMASPNPVITISSPYKFVSTASGNLEEYIQALLTVQRFQRGLSAARSEVIHRGVQKEGDYARLTKEQRDSHIARNKLTLNPAAFVDAHLIVIDDIRVTGRHELKMWRVLQNTGFMTCTFVYVATVNQSHGNNDPQLEDRVNHAKIKTLTDLSEMIQNASAHRINARLTRHLMTHPNMDEIRAFLDTMTDLFVTELAIAYLGDEYFQFEQYANRISDILKYAYKRGCIESSLIPTGL